MKIATGKEERPPELDTFAAAFAVAGEKQEMVADQETLVGRRKAKDFLWDGYAMASVNYRLAAVGENIAHPQISLP